MTTSTAGLTKSIRSALQATRAQHTRSERRTIDPSGAAELASLVRASIRSAQSDDVAAVITVVGGAVPNSYRGTAMADRLEVFVDLEEGTWRVWGERGFARRCAGGTGPWATVYLRRAGQSRGRLVHSE